MRLDLLDGIVNHCRTSGPLGVVEAANGNIESLLCRNRDDQNLRYLMLEIQRLAATQTKIGGLQESRL